MSSGSEDLDEDELLQMALKEQAERDLNYQRPPASSNNKQRKPVVNYVQPPPPPPKKPAAPNNSNSRAAAAARRVADEDDDSEVEMLSISSGDDDSTTRDHPHNRPSRARPSSARDDDVAWDGDEPSSWKYVEEAELARRVREMRETRTAPVAQKFERKPSAIGRKGLTSLQSLPRGTECIDPLGLGIIDNKSLRLITETAESSPSKLDRDYLDSSLRDCNEVRGAYGVGVWKCIRNGWVDLSNNFRIEMGRGTRTRFWSDIWCGDIALKNTFPSLYRIALGKDASVADNMVTSAGSFQWFMRFTRAVQDWEVDDITELYRALYALNLKAEGEDRLHWKHTGNNFSVRSFYKVLLPHSSIAFPWKSICRSYAPLKVAFF